MTALFITFQTPEGTCGTLFESDIKDIPCIGDGIVYPYSGACQYAEVMHVIHCFRPDGKFDHIEVELKFFPSSIEV